MTARWIYSFFVLVILISCSKKTFDTPLNLKALPVSSSTAINETRALRDYAEKLNKIDTEKIISQLENQKEREQFKHRIIDLKVSYNKCVDKLNDVEKAAANDKAEKLRELKENMAELDAIWKYLIVNYKI